MPDTDNVGQTVVAAASTQVLCPYNEEEPAICFHFIEVQFTAAGIKSQSMPVLSSASLVLENIGFVYPNVIGHSHLY